MTSPTNSSAAPDAIVAKTPRAPLPSHGIDVNFCKAPKCANFGVPISQTAERGVGASNPYTIVSVRKNAPAARCNACGEIFTLKSNAGVAEETLRILADTLTHTACPEALCANHRVPVETPGVYQAFGETPIGSKRYRCKACRKTFSVKPSGINPIAKQQQSDKNRTLLALITNKMPLRRICEAADVSPPVLYQRIDFFHEQALAFLADRERHLEHMEFKRLYLGVDRQDYAVNWSGRKDKRNVMLSAVASADNGTGYVFGMHVNFDPELDPDEVETAACVAGDSLAAYPHRKFARLWLKSDFAEAIAATRKQQSKGDLDSTIATTYANTLQRPDTEAADIPCIEDRLPAKGMLVHSEYTLHGHFLALRRLLAGTEKIRFFLDQESGIRGACIGAFSDLILQQRCDAFYVSIAKHLTVDEKRHRLNDAEALFAEAAASMPGMNEVAVKLALLKQRIAEGKSIGPWKDRWVRHPLPTISEPEKALCYLTDFGQYDDDPDHLAWLYNKASLHSVDSFFNRLRRRFVMLERPISSAANRGRVWNGYSAYRPEQIAKLLTIARVCHNYVWLGEGKKAKTRGTPAMRLGLAKAPLDLSDIIYFR